MNDEKEIIMSLYRDGKITEAQKNALLAAIDPASDGNAHVEARGKETGAEPKERKKVTFKVVGMENPYDASRVSTAVAGIAGVKKATANIAQSEVVVTGDFEADAVISAVRAVGFTCKPVGVEYVDDRDGESVSEPFESVAFDSDETIETDETVETEEHAEEIKKSVTEKLSGLGKMISDAVKSGFESLTDMEDKIAKYFDCVLYGEGGGDVVVKCKAEKYDEPYETLTATVKIVNSKGVVTFVRKCSQNDMLKRECAAIMSDAAFDALDSLLENKFTGKYKYVCGSDIFKLTVKPE